MPVENDEPDDGGEPRGDPRDEASARAARAEATRLARRLTALPEPAMRRVVLAETIVSVPAPAAVRVLGELIRGARLVSGPPFTTALAAVAAGLGDSALLPYERRALLYAAAKEADLHDVARLFFAAASGPVREPEEPEPEQVIIPRGRPLTLGERKAMARGGRREFLSHLLRDPDPAVIRVLLDNPRLTEPDAVKVAARRPARGDVLRAVFESRWVLRYHIKRALVMNPYSPTDLAVRLVPTLTVPDLRAVADDRNLPAPVRAQAQIVLVVCGKRKGEAE